MVETSNSAGTVVAAVLETLGYATQAEILKTFDPFWKSGASLFWTIACIGAVVSIAVYGSARMASYTLIGPMLFFFLIYSRTPVDPVVWQLGGAPPEKVNYQLQGPLEGRYPVAPVEVSSFFALYTKAINRFVNSLVDFILLEEKKEELYFVTRAQVLERILNGTAERTKLYAIFENVFVADCQPMMETMTALGSDEFDERYRKHLEELQAKGDTNAGAALAKLEMRRAALKKEITGGTDAEGKPVRAVGEIRTNPNEAMRTFMKDQTESGKKDYTPMVPADRGDPRAYAAKGFPGLDLSCSQVWEVASDAAVSEAHWFMEKLYSDVLKGKDDPAEKRKILCETLSQKIYQPGTAGAAECDLTQAAALFLVRNSIYSSDMSQIARRVMDRTHLVSGAQGKFCSNKDAKPPANPALNTGGSGSNEEWCRAIDIEAPGMFAAAFSLTQAYESAGFEQKIYTAALNLPYWQGILLYYMSVLYPFMALLVVVAVKARNFLFLPLAWLWVKSWDVGFAMVMLLDRILWNLLPSPGIPPGAGELGKGLASEAMPKLLTTALSMDPTFHIYIHHNFVALALFSVPTITGAAILKGRQNVLARFTQESEQAAQDATGRAQGVWADNTIRELQQRFDQATSLPRPSLNGADSGTGTTGSSPSVPGGAPGSAAPNRAADPQRIAIARRLQAAIGALDRGGGFNLPPVPGQAPWRSFLGLLVQEFFDGPKPGGTSAMGSLIEDRTSPALNQVIPVKLEQRIEIAEAWRRYRERIGMPSPAEGEELLQEAGVLPPDDE